MKYRYRNVNQVINNLTHDLSKLENIGEDIVKDVADILVNEERKTVPVDTGDLKKSITQRKVTNLIRRVNLGQKYYAGYVEFGTSRMKAQPYVRPSLLVTRSKVPATITKNLKKWARR